MHEKVTPLKAWLKRTKTKQVDMYEKLGIGRTTFSSIASGHNKPAARTAFKIERLTNGEVQAEDLYKGLREELEAMEED